MKKIMMTASLAFLALHAARADVPPPGSAAPTCMLREATNVTGAKVTLDSPHLATIKATGTLPGWKSEGEGDLVWRSLAGGKASYELMILSCNSDQHNASTGAAITPVQRDDIPVAAAQTIIIFAWKNRLSLKLSAASPAPVSQNSCLPKPVYSVDEAEILFMVPNQYLFVSGTAPGAGWTNLQLQLSRPISGTTAIYQLVACAPSLDAQVLTRLDATRTYLVPGLTQIIIKASSNQKILNRHDLPF